MRHLAILLVLFFGLTQYADAEKGSSSHLAFSDTLRIKNDLKIITKTKQSRNFRNPETLNFVADYIFHELSKKCDTVYYQSYFVNGIEYKNVIGSIGSGNPERIVVGAHYDVCGDQAGADDNASGVVGLLELARLLSSEPLNYRIDFVAYSLEEPPYFRTENMGSFVHAKMLFDKQEKVKGMICLEMIGYYNDEPDSQSYPAGILKLFYGKKGDYITVVQKFGNGCFGRQVKRLMKKPGFIPTKSFKAPVTLTGVDFSDHQNYWKYGYSAVMITNTSFYRNKNYHEKTDQMETLDLQRMGLVIDEIYFTLKKLK